MRLNRRLAGPTRRRAVQRTQENSEMTTAEQKTLEDYRQKGWHDPEREWLERLERWAEEDKLRETAEGRRTLRDRIEQINCGW